MKIVTVIGARPQFIKASVVSRAFKQCEQEVEEVLVHTGQHYDANMSDIFFDELGISKPNYNLGVGGGSHGQNTGRMIEKIEEILLKEKPGWLVVYGDTDSTLAAALAAVKLHIPVAHIEAGLRSFNRRMPEEINRILTDHTASMLFAPTDEAVKHLLKEGIDASKIHQVGDVMFDVALEFSKKAERECDVLEALGLISKKYILATIHRQENTDNKSRLKTIIEGLSTSNIPVILPLHPRTRKQLKEFNIEIKTPIYLTEPVGYLDMVLLEKNAKLIATDSGGIQKEAYFHQVPCITLRDETEWVELVDYGYNCLVGANKKKIEDALQSKPVKFSHKDIYGDGFAAKQIIQKLLMA